MAYMVKQDITTDSEAIATVAAALIATSTITTFHQVYVMKDGSSKYIVVLVYEGT